MTWQLSTAANLHHGTHSIHMLLPSFGIEDQAALDLREAWHWPSVTWDLLGAAVALYYLSLRGSYASVLRGAQLFEDLKITELLGEKDTEVELGPGELRRVRPATVVGGDAPT